MSNNRVPMTEEMFADWWEHPVSQVLRNAALARRQTLHELWEQGDFFDMFDHASALKNARGVGMCETLVWLINLDFEILKGEAEDGDERWLQTPRSAEQERLRAIRTRSAAENARIEEEGGLD